MLRPIGTEFDYLYWPSETSGKSVFTVFRYRVVAHDECQKRSGMNEGLDVRKTHPIGAPYLAERLEPIAMTEYPVTSWTITPDGRFMAEPPPGVAGLVA